MHSIGPAVFYLALFAAIAAPINAATPERLTKLAGDEDHPRISPDGRLVAFDADDGDKKGIYVLNLMTRGVRRVLSLPGGASHPTWSPDGKRLAFRSTEDGRGAIWVAGADGSDPQPLYVPADGNVLGPDWSPDGKTIAMTRIVADPSSSEASPQTAKPASVAGESEDSAGSPSIPIPQTASYSWGRATAWIVGADGVSRSTVTAREITTGGQEWLARWTPDSRGLMYYLGWSDDLEVVSVSSSEVTPISRGQYVGWRPVPSPDGKSVAFVSAGTRWNVWLASTSEDHPPLRLSAGGDDDYPDWSPDGQWIVFSRDRSTERTWRLDLETGRRSLVAERATEPGPTPRGKQIAFLTDAEHEWELRMTDEDGRGMKKVDVGLAHPIKVAWSPFDANLVAVVAVSGQLDGEGDLYLADLSSGKPRRLTRTGDVFAHPVWCDGGRSILFASRGGNKLPYRQIWKHTLATGSVVQLTDSRLNKWPTDCSPDGRKITYHKSGGEPGVFTLRQDDNAGWTAVKEGPGSGGRWSPDGSRLAYLDRVDGRKDIFVLEADGSRRRLTRHQDVESSPAWTADGKALIFSTRERNRDLWRMKVPELPWLAEAASKEILD